MPLTTDLAALSVTDASRKGFFDQLTTTHAWWNMLKQRKEEVGGGNLPQIALRAIRGGAERVKDMQALGVTRKQIAAYATAPYYAMANACAVVSGPELSDAGQTGPYVLFKIGEARMQDRDESLEFLIGQDSVTATVATGGGNEALLGAGELFKDATSTYLNISRTTYTWWQFIASTGSIGGDYIKYIRDGIVDVWIKGEVLTDVFVDGTIYKAIADRLAVPIYQIREPGQTTSGFSAEGGKDATSAGIPIGTVTVRADPDMPANTMYGVVRNRLHLLVKKDYNPKLNPWMTLAPYYDAMAANKLIRHQMMTDRSQVHVKITLS